jgi:uncharacterized membrane protein YedE/YeeE
VQQSSDLLHIPTPWHNSIVEIDGSDVLFLTKAKMVREAIAKGLMEGGFVGAGEFGGGYFKLARLQAGQEGSAPIITERVSEQHLVVTSPESKHRTVVVNVDQRGLQVIRSWIIGILGSFLAGYWDARNLTWWQWHGGYVQASD